MLAAADVSGAIHEPAHTEDQAGRELKRETLVRKSVSNYMPEVDSLFGIGLWPW